MSRASTPVHVSNTCQLLEAVLEASASPLAEANKKSSEGVNSTASENNAREENKAEKSDHTRTLEKKKVSDDLKSQESSVITQKSLNCESNLKIPQKYSLKFPDKTEDIISNRHNKVENSSSDVILDEINSPEQNLESPVAVHRRRIKKRCCDVEGCESLSIEDIKSDKIRKHGQLKIHKKNKIAVNKLKHDSNQKLHECKVVIEKSDIFALKIASLGPSAKKEINPVENKAYAASEAKKDLIDVSNKIKPEKNLSPDVNPVIPGNILFSRLCRKPDSPKTAPLLAVRKNIIIEPNSVEHSRLRFEQQRKYVSEVSVPKNSLNLSEPSSRSMNHPADCAAPKTKETPKTTELVQENDSKIKNNLASEMVTCDLQQRNDNYIQKPKYVEDSCNMNDEYKLGIKKAAMNNVHRDTIEKVPDPNPEKTSKECSKMSSEHSSTQDILAAACSAVGIDDDIGNLIDSIDQNQIELPANQNADSRNIPQKHLNPDTNRAYMMAPNVSLVRPNSEAAYYSQPKTTVAASIPKAGMYPMHRQPYPSPYFNYRGQYPYMHPSAHQMNYQQISKVPSPAYHHQYDVRHMPYNRLNASQRHYQPREQMSHVHRHPNRESVPHQISHLGDQYQAPYYNGHYYQHPNNYPHGVVSKVQVEKVNNEVPPTKPGVPESYHPHTNVPVSVSKIPNRAMHHTREIVQPPLPLQSVQSHAKDYNAHYLPNSNVQSDPANRIPEPSIIKKVVNPAYSHIEKEKFYSSMTSKSHDTSLLPSKQVPPQDKDLQISHYTSENIPREYNPRQYSYDPRLNLSYKRNKVPNNMNHQSIPRRSSSYEDYHRVVGHSNAGSPADQVPQGSNVHHQIPSPHSVIDSNPHSGTDLRHRSGSYGSPQSYMQQSPQIPVSHASTRANLQTVLKAPSVQTTLPSLQYPSMSQISPVQDTGKSQHSIKKPAGIIYSHTAHQNQREESMVRSGYYGSPTKSTTVENPLHNPSTVRSHYHNYQDQKLHKPDVHQSQYMERIASSNIRNSPPTYPNVPYNSHALNSCHYGQNYSKDQLASQVCQVSPETQYSRGLRESGEYNLYAQHGSNYYQPYNPKQQSHHAQKSDPRPICDPKQNVIGQSGEQYPHSPASMTNQLSASSANYPIGATDGSATITKVRNELAVKDSTCTPVTYPINYSSYSGSNTSRNVHQYPVNYVKANPLESGHVNRVQDHSAMESSSHPPNHGIGNADSRHGSYYSRSPQSNAVSAYTPQGRPSIPWDPSRKEHENAQLVSHLSSSYQLQGDMYPHHHKQHSPSLYTPQPHSPTVVVRNPMATPQPSNPQHASSDVTNKASKWPQASPNNVAAETLSGM